MIGDRCTVYTTENCTKPDEFGWSSRNLQWLPQSAEQGLTRRKCWRSWRYRCRERPARYHCLLLLSSMKQHMPDVNGSNAKSTVRKINAWNTLAHPNTCRSYPSVFFVAMRYCKCQSTSKQYFLCVQCKWNRWFHLYKLAQSLHLTRRASMHQELLLHLTDLQLYLCGALRKKLTPSSVRCVLGEL